MSLTTPPERSDAGGSRRRGLAALIGLAAAGALLVALTWQAAAPRIEENRRLFEQQELADVLADEPFDNRLTDSGRPLDDPLARETGVTRAWLALQGERPAGVVLRAVARDGYSGSIVLLLGISPEGQVLGVRVTEHRETPGLGDAIELARSPWIGQFTTRSLGDPPSERWRVRRDGGDFDGITGATITARAVTGAIGRALLYFERERDALLAPPQHESDR
jgi:Na+-translocating ferredoxin:NAD+ oxidoreductase subunit G